MMSSRALLLVLATLSAAAGACAERSVASPETGDPNGVALGVGATAAPLVGTTWALYALAGHTLDAATHAVRPLRLTFESPRRVALVTSLGCNTISGAVDTLGARLRVVGDLGSTRIYCGEALSALELGYATALGEVAYFGLRGDTLWLYDGTLQLRARYRAAR